MNLAELLIDENIDQVSALNTGFEVTVWNKACEIATGIKKSEIIGKSIFHFFPAMKTEPIVFNSLNAALSGYKSFVPHDTVGSGMYAERHFIPLKDEQNSVIGVFIVTHDVSHRLKAEQELKVLNKSLENFKRIIDSAHDIIITFDINGAITYWNKAAGTLFGYTPDEMLGQSLSLLMPEDEKYQLPYILDELGRDSSIDLITRRRTKSGEEIDVAVNFFPLIDENNVLIGGCKIAKDITEILKYQKSIEALNNELTLRNRQLASVNSELKTFTNIAVTSYSETLRQLYLHFEYITANEAGKLSDPGKANIRKAQAAIQKMKLLTNDIIAFTRLNELDTEIRHIDLNAVFKTIVDDLKNLIEATNAKVTIGQLPELQGYPFLVALIFYHLLENAIKFRKEKATPVIKVFPEPPQKGSQIAHEAARPGVSYNIVAMSDNGIGFEGGETENIFQIFTRLHPAKYKGSGIGLAICKKAMELHGGFITTESTPGQGSTFRCYFPKER